MRVAPPQIENSSTTEPAEDIIAAGKHYGLEFELTTVKSGLGDEKDEEAANAAEVKDPSKPVEGEKAAETEQPGADDESKTEVEGKSADEQAELTESEKKLKKALKDRSKQIDKLTGRAKTAESAKEALEAEIAELRQKIAGNKESVAKAEEPDNAPKRPQRPAAPRLSQFAYDQQKYEEAVDKYENETIPEYEDALSVWTRTEAVREVTERQQREQEQQAIEQESQEWNEVLDAHEGIREKIAAATDVMMAPAMEVVLRGLFAPEQRLALTEYLIDNPEESERIMKLTLPPGGREKVSANEWALLTSVATREFSSILSGKSAYKPAKAGPVEVAKPKESQSQPPAKPKPPVSAAPAPIAPVGARNGASATRLDDPNIPFDNYLAERTAQTLARRKAGMR